MKKLIIQVGQKVQFDPFETVIGYGVEVIRGMVEGTIVEVYADHKWFSVEYGEPKQRTSFNFCDVGELVMIIG